jgi:hypothetical protein
MDLAYTSHLRFSVRLYGLVMMNPNKNLLLAKFNGNPPANLAALKNFEGASGYNLPADYAQFLQMINGGEGFIGSNIYIILWRIEELLELNTAYQVKEYAPGLLLFGSDSGGEAFGFDMRSSIKEIVSIPFVGMDLKLSRPIAPDFNKFLEILSKS